MPLQIITAEVIALNDDAIWMAFKETGDPIYYLLYKSVESLQDKYTKEE